MNYCIFLGGKWTTYRSMAIDAVNAAVKYCGLKQKRESGTDGLILDGGYRWTPNHYIKLAQNYGTFSYACWAAVLHFRSALALLCPRQ